MQNIKTILPPFSASQEYMEHSTIELRFGERSTPSSGIRTCMVTSSDVDNGRLAGCVVIAFRVWSRNAYLLKRQLKQKIKNSIFHYLFFFW